MIRVPCVLLRGREQAGGSDLFQMDLDWGSTEIMKWES